MSSEVLRLLRAAFYPGGRWARRRLAEAGLKKLGWSRSRAERLARRMP
jgi:hypothetical protein